MTRPLTGHLALPITGAPRSYDPLTVAQDGSGGWWLYETAHGEPLALRPLTRAEAAWAELASRRVAPPSPSSPRIYPPPPSLYAPSPAPPPPRWQPHADLLGEEGVDWSEPDDPPTDAAGSVTSPFRTSGVQRTVGEVVLSLITGGRA